MMEHAQNGKRHAKPRELREASADLQSRLAAKQCEHCATVGLWRIATTAANVRYVQCGACGKYAKLVTA